MERNRLTAFAASLLATAGFVTLAAAPAAAQSEIVLHARNASQVVGDWQVASDSTAAGGARLWNPDRGATKLSSAYANPYDYFELTFNAEAGRAYRLWVRGKAENNLWTNDSIYAQFSGAVTASGGALYRIGTTSAAMVSIEACSGCGVSNWGWEDNGYDGAGPTVYFESTGTQTIRFQKREDGISVDQIVLSAGTYLSNAPGARLNDSTILTATSSTTPTTAPYTPEPSASGEVVIHAAASASLRGGWQVVSDSTAAGGARVANPDYGQAKLSSPLAAPGDYFEVAFTAEAGRAYHLWIRGRAQDDYWGNDSVFVQFSGSVNASNSPVYRIGSTSAATVSLEDCGGCGVSGWMWNDNGYGSLGAPIYFAASGTQTLRVQRREDGISIDQIVVSPATYLSSAPGAARNDTTILAASGGTSAPAPTEPAPAPAPAPEPEPAPAPSGGVRLRVMEWNIRHGVGADGVYNIERQANWLANSNPDVIVLNEVEKYTSWGNEDQPARFKAMMQARTGRTWYSHFSQEYGQWSSNGKGHLILSTYPFESVSHATITASSGLGGGGAISQARITVNGRTVTLLLTHLDPYDSSMRLVQALDVIRWSASHAENRILAGDMNAWPDQASILEINRTYYDAWTTAANQGTATGIGDVTPFGATKRGRIDYIFYSKNAPNLVVIDARTPDTRDSNGYMASDHRPVVVTFEVR